MPKFRLKVDNIGNNMSVYIPQARVFTEWVNIVIKDDVAVLTNDSKLKFKVRKDALDVIEKYKKTAPRKKLTSYEYVN